jgi:hypothetical protein
MNTFWLKIMGLAVLAVAVIIVISFFTPGADSESPEPEPEEPQKTFYDQAEEDKQKFLAEPQALDSQTQTPASEQAPTIENQTVAQTAPPKPAQPMLVYFKELGEIDQIEASRLLNVAVPGRSIGRLPMTGFKLMVDSCRTIIRRWPESQFAYKAKQLLADLPVRYQKRYKVTEEEKNVSMFAEQRPGTTPFTIKEDPR